MAGSEDPLGSAIREIRLLRNKTQTQLSRESGLAVSFLSRVENGHINPSVSTLRRLAKVLEVSVGAFFGSDSSFGDEDHCPVSMDGRCVLEHVIRKSGRPAPEGIESYSPEELRLLRLFNRLLHSDDRQIRNSLKTLLRALDESSRRPARD